MYLKSYETNEYMKISYPISVFLNQEFSRYTQALTLFHALLSETRYRIELTCFSYQLFGELFIFSRNERL